MATARPSIVARIGAVADRVMIPLRALIPVSPMPTPTSAFMRGRPAAISDPNVIASTMYAMSRPRASDVCVVGWLTMPPPKATVAPAAACRRRRGGEVPLGGISDVARGDLEGNGGIGDATVLRDRLAVVGVGDEQHLCPLSSLRQCRLDSRLDLGVIERRTIGRGKDDLRRGTRRGREALLQQVHGLLGLGAGDGELVRFRLRDGEREGGHRNEDHQPTEQGRPAVPVRRPADLRQQTCHSLLRLAGPVRYGMPG